MREVFFPNGGVASDTAVMKNGAMVEIATVGDEGMVGINALYGVDLLGTEAMMQVPDTNAEVLPVAIFNGSLNGAARGTNAFYAVRRVFWFR